jgi:hypothetical protein
VLRRIGQNELALEFLTRAIQIGATAGEEDFSGPDAFLALAEAALDAGEHDLALVAIARARDLGEDREDVEAYVRRLLTEIDPEGDEKSGRSLICLLEALAS